MNALGLKLFHKNAMWFLLLQVLVSQTENILIKIAFGVAIQGDNENECDLKALRPVPHHLVRSNYWLYG